MGLPNKSLRFRIGLPKLKPDQEATVIDLNQETAAWTSLPTRDRLRALQRIIPQAQVEEVLVQTVGQSRYIALDRGGR
jgi:hypothetical protein